VVARTGALLASTGWADALPWAVLDDGLGDRYPRWGRGLVLLGYRFENTEHPDFRRAHAAVLARQHFGVVAYHYRRSLSFTVLAPIFPFAIVRRRYAQIVNRALVSVTAEKRHGRRHCFSQG
jgi:hypothetical protein